MRYGEVNANNVILWKYYNLTGYNDKNEEDMKKSKELNQIDLAENIERYLNIIDEVEYWVLKYCYGIRRIKDTQPYAPLDRYKEPYLVTKDELEWLEKFYLMFNLNKDDHKVINDVHIILSKLSNKSAYDKYSNEETFKQNSNTLRYIEKYMQRILKDIRLHPLH